MKKISKMNELAWVLGIVLCALGIALYIKAGFGLSMVAAPPYLIHLKIVEIFPWYTQGTSEYILQTVLLIILCVIIKKVKLNFVLSFATAIISGMVLDFWLFVLGGGELYGTIGVRILAFILGELSVSMAIAFFFRTAMPLQSYEVFVKEIASFFNIEISKVKMGFDISFLILSVGLAVFLNRSFQGIGIGTVILTVINAPLINMFGKLFDKIFVFDMAFPKLEKILAK